MNAPASAWPRVMPRLRSNTRIRARLVTIMDITTGGNSAISTPCARSAKVTALSFGRDAMNRVTNHKEGGIADVYDRHRYQEENKRIMEAVARHIVGVAEGRDNVVALGRGD